MEHWFVRVMARSEELNTVDQARILFSIELICPPVDSFCLKGPANK